MQACSWLSTADVLATTFAIISQVNKLTISLKDILTTKMTLTKVFISIT